MVGKDPVDVTWQILSSLMGNDSAKQFNFTDRGGKESIRNFTAKIIIYK